MNIRILTIPTLIIIATGLSIGCSFFGPQVTDSPARIYHIDGPQHAVVGQAVEISVWADAGPSGGYNLKKADAEVNTTTQAVTIRATKTKTTIPGLAYPQMVLGYKLATTSFTPQSTGTYHIQAELFTADSYYPVEGTPNIPASPSATLDISVTAS